MNFAILGCGYTGKRVAAHLIESGARVVIATPHPENLEIPGARVMRWDATAQDSASELRDVLEPGIRVLYSVPLLEGTPGVRLVTPALIGIAGRVVYISTTGVYGAAAEVDETTVPALRPGRELLRWEEERGISAGPWESLILRPAAIYGPGRGVHASLREGRHKVWGDGSNFISRIHVDDLARHCVAALSSSITGEFPVADEEPCTAIEIARFCAGLMGLGEPEPSGELPSEDTRRVNRRVDGSAIRLALGISLRYRSYRTGIPAALEEESTLPGFSAA